MILWLTGLPGSGKSTLANGLEHRLKQQGIPCYVLDGDVIRKGLSADLGFSPADRSENIRRIGEVAALFSDAGLVAIIAFISPYRADRARARLAGGAAFHEIYIKAPLNVCESRDPKGHYRRARSGEIPEFTGVSAPYEAPEAADLVVETNKETVEESLDRLMNYVRARLKAG